MVLVPCSWFKCAGIRAQGTKTGKQMTESEWK
ncbi:hypothetical protein KC19_2G126500 [Ceratodon purpureus]|uniref:Uncharacterized protein n=1 Tax=Ceratodon purpureus TaxID=3225 RepID=A0A8T0IW53_CERPU|nr:hypothetical protein KC19_2G126500 [Ceratodon purpureus]